MRHNLFLILCLLSSLTCNTLALRWDGPRATKLARARISSIAEPTTPPDLARRRDVDVGNPAFCGFGDAEKDNPWQCADDKKTCMLHTDLKVQGCCDTLKKDAKCDLYTGCKDGDSRTNPGVDPLMLLCKDKSLTCATITYTSKFVQYACVTDPSALPKTIDSTYKKQPKDAKTADLYMVGKKELGDPASRSSSKSSSRSSTSTTSSSTTSSKTDTPTPTPGSPPLDGTSKTKKIAGIAVGSIVGGILAISLFAMWHIRRTSAQSRLQKEKLKSMGTAYTGVTQAPSLYEPEVYSLPPSPEQRPVDAVPQDAIVSPMSPTGHEDQHHDRPPSPDARSTRRLLD